MTAPLTVDGARPAVERVAALPRGWVTVPERLVLHVLAADSFEGAESAPGWENLAAWTGMHRSSVVEIVQRLTRPTDHRPALLALESVGGRHRVTFRLLLPEPSGGAGWLNRPVGPDG